MAEKKQPGTRNLANVNQVVVSNIYGLKVDQNLRVFRNDVTIQAVKRLAAGTEKAIDLTKKARSE